MLWLKVVVAIGCLVLLYGIWCWAKFIFTPKDMPDNYEDDPEFEPLNNKDINGNTKL